jgi:hypothetical protein
MLLVGDEQLTIIACGDSPAIRNGLPPASTRYRPFSETFSGYFVSAPLDSDADKTMAQSIAPISKYIVIQLRFARRKFFDPCVAGALRKEGI